MDQEAQLNGAAPHGLSVEGHFYAALTAPVARADAARLLHGLGDGFVTWHERDPGLVAAFSVTTAPGAALLQPARDGLQSGVFSWVEFGWRGFMLVDDARETRPWTRRASLDAAALAALTTLEPFVLYHAPSP